MNKPLLLKPAAKDYLWGGSRLNDDFGKAIQLSTLAETWECSTHPDGQSLVAETGEPLGELLNRHLDYLGSHPLHLTGGKAELPILIKLIDAKQDLSVQVHPDDEYAWKHERSLGKTELWYVLAAKRDAELVYGFRKDMSQEQVKKAIREKRIEEDLNHIPVHKNEVFFVEAGTVHAVGAGVLLAEIQENSNVTYRLYDYDRVQSDPPVPRPLHIEKSIDVINVPHRDADRNTGGRPERLVSCEYYTVDKYVIENSREFVQERPFEIVSVIEGAGDIDGTKVKEGDSLIVPCDYGKYAVNGNISILITGV